MTEHEPDLKQPNKTEHNDAVASVSYTNKREKSVKSTPVVLVSGGPNQCARCSKTVGFAEKVSAMSQTWHKDCFYCGSCSKRLNTG